MSYLRINSRGIPFSDALEIHVLELPKLRRQSLRKDWHDDECWGLYLDNLDGEEMERIAERKPSIKRAMTVEDVFTKNAKERELYELREKSRRDYLNAMNTAETRGKKEVAKRLLARGDSLPEVAEISGLPLETVKSLIN